MKLHDLYSFKLWARRLNLRAARTRIGIDIPYGTDPRNILDIYAPHGQKPATPLPVVVFWHGGSWRRGDKTSYAFFAAALADAGFLVVTHNYRFFPAHTFDDILSDSAAATEWVYQHITEYGGDYHNIVLMGHSAGAQLAALIAHDRHYLAALKVPAHAIKAFIGVSGIYNFSNHNHQGGLFNKNNTSHPWQVIEHLGTGVPTLLIHGRIDMVVGYTASVRMARALKKKGSPVELLLYSHLEHMATIGVYAKPLHWIAPIHHRTVQFIRTHTR